MSFYPSFATIVQASAERYYNVKWDIRLDHRRA